MKKTTVIVMLLVAFSQVLFSETFEIVVNKDTNFIDNMGEDIGKVVLAKDQGDSCYGLSLLIKGDRQEDGKNLFYLLGHLSRYETGIGKGSTVSPGQTVGYVGNTGNCYTAGHKVSHEERAAGKGAHLHVSVYKTEKQHYELYKRNSDEITFRTELKDDKNGESDLVNPFNHNDHRRFK